DLFYDFVGISFTWNTISWNYLGSTSWIVVGVFVMGMLVSGLLPARIMASIPAIEVLKGKFMGIRKGRIFRQTSVVFQFVCAIALLMAVIAFNRQFKLMN